MSEQAAAASERIPRVSNLSVETFVSEFLKNNRPVIVTHAMQSWKALERWTPDQLIERFGNERVQVYGDLFRLIDITTLSQYLQRYFGQSAEVRKPESPPQRL